MLYYFKYSKLLWDKSVSFLKKLKTINMGIFWDLMQQNEIQEQGKKAENLEERVSKLEKELIETKSVLKKTLIALENYLEKDIDGDGKTGS